MRIGQGFDIHAFSHNPHRPMVLGGVVIPGVVGLDGHSDADVVAHAIGDALLGAAGLGDLGKLFPDDDPSWAGANSLSLLSIICSRIGALGLKVINADCTVVAEAPRLGTHIPAMVKALSSVLFAPVSVKATRAEGLGSLGRAEGVACSAVVLLDDQERPDG